MFIMFKKIIAVSCLLITSTFAMADANIIYLTRHAEKEATGTDPGLTAEGQQRAANIAALLKRAGISAVYSTPYARTEQTAQPLATLGNLPVTSYDPSQLAAFADQLKNTTGHTLVVGHSNTTPDLVNLLGGQAEPIAETEFDRLYQVIIDDSGLVSTVLLTTTAAGADTASCADVTVNLTNLAAATGQWQQSTIDVPECANTLVVNMTGGSGDGDLYVNFGSNPTTTTYACRPFKSGNTETCTINNPKEGTWHIGIQAYQGFSGVSLNAVAKGSVNGAVKGAVKG